VRKTSSVGVADRGVPGLRRTGGGIENKGQRDKREYENELWIPGRSRGRSRARGQLGGRKARVGVRGERVFGVCRVGGGHPWGNKPRGSE